MLDACLRMDEMLRSGANRAGQIDYSLTKKFQWWVYVAHPYLISSHTMARKHLFVMSM